MSVLLILDFDGTITEQDTLAHLAAYGYSLHTQDDHQRPTWTEISQDYMRDLKQHISSTENHEKDLPELLLSLASRLPVERASVERVERAKIFQGATPDGLQAAGRKAVESEIVSMRSKVAECISAVIRTGGAVGILSVNWSANWIKGCLSAVLNAEDLEQIVITANELVFDETGVATGDLNRRWPDAKGGSEGLWTSKHKAQALREDWMFWLSQPARRTIYVGDSMTDLGALVAVDVGIVIGQGQAGAGIRGIWEGFGQPWRNLAAWEEERRPNGLFWIRGFDEILYGDSLKRKFLPH